MTATACAAGSSRSFGRRPRAAIGAVAAGACLAAFAPRRAGADLAVAGPDPSGWEERCQESLASQWQRQVPGASLFGSIERDTAECERRRAPPSRRPQLVAFARFELDADQCVPLVVLAVGATHGSYGRSAWSQGPVPARLATWLPARATQMPMPPPPTVWQRQANGRAALLYLAPRWGLARRGLERVLESCLASTTTPPPVAPESAVRDCTPQQWRALKRASRRDCRGELCPELVRDLSEKIFCDGAEPDTPDNRQRCAAAVMMREGPGRCQRIGPQRYRINVDCWGWEVRLSERTVSGIRATGECD